MNPVKTGIEGLDKMLKGGLLRGRTILLSGPAGSGKSTLAMQFAYNGAMKFNENALYLSLEEEKQKIIENMSKLGFDIKKAEASGKLLLIGGNLADVRASMDEVDAKITHLIEELGELIREHNIKRVVIDSINVFLMLLDTIKEKRIALAKLSRMLSSLGCTSMFVSETKEGTMDISRHGIEEFVVDGVIVLYLVREGPKFVPGIAVRKMRGINHDKEIRLFDITNEGVVVYPNETMFTNL
ncbi:MAG: AAA family ATPase [Nanoarchaeota archaeon]|nr:AAA family ATPase [Nanoarchaeota archaeon]